METAFYTNIPPQFTKPSAQANRKDSTRYDYFALFLKSREAMGVSPRTLEFYRDRLGRYVFNTAYTGASREQIQELLNSIPPNRNGLATRHASYRALKTFFRWLQAEYGISNPMANMQAPILGKPILPSLTKSQVITLIEKSSNIRNKAIIALFTESGLRLTELAGIRLQDIDWQSYTIRIWGKNRKEAYATFGPLSEQYLKLWLDKYEPNRNIWGITKSGITTMLQRLEESTGITCNPHTFRRTFAVLLRKAGVDTMTIKELGRWESIQMVQRYTRSFSFHDSLKFYKPPLQ